MFVVSVYASCIIEDVFGVIFFEFSTETGAATSVWWFDYIFVSAVQSH